MPNLIDYIVGLEPIC